MSIFKTTVKRWPYLVFALLLLAGIAWTIYEERDRLGLQGFFPAQAAEEEKQPIQWLRVDLLKGGFTVEMPEGIEERDVLALDEKGGAQPVKMLRSSPDGQTSYAVTWSDNPPVARVNQGQPERTLDQARDGMLASTQTTLITETKEPAHGYHARIILARNAQGGILHARLIVEGSNQNNRLYTLMALFPHETAHSAQDVHRFFYSFTPEPPAN